MALVAIPVRFATRRGIRIQAQWVAPVEAICRRFGVLVSSGYRSPADNRAAGGAPNSDHLRGDAADFVGNPGGGPALYAWARGRFPYVEPLSQSVDHVHISFRHLGKGGETYKVGGRTIKVLRGAAAVTALYELAHANHLDPLAAAAVAYEEGATGKIGDHGTSYGPWQLHIHGALPARWARLGPHSAKTNAWAWSRPGFAYALGAMARAGAAGKHGHEAVHTIVHNFEHPHDPAYETKYANVQYDFLHRQGAGVRATLASWFFGPTTPGTVVVPPTTPTPTVSAHGAGAAWSALMRELGVHTPARAARVRAVAHNLRRRVS